MLSHQSSHTLLFFVFLIVVAARKKNTMVALSSHKTSLDESLVVNTCKASTMFTGVPEINLSDPEAKTLIVKACQQFGSFKLVNHDVPIDLMTKLENEALKFFDQPQAQKEEAGPPDPYGYGSKRIGPNGDMGWVEYLLLHTNPHVISPKTFLLLEQITKTFRYAVHDYIIAAKNMCCNLLELIANGLGIEQKNVLSKLIKDERSDSCFRVNRYPSCREREVEAMVGPNLIGFGEHTDPQIISILRSNNASGLQICLQDGTWVSIPPDHTSFFIIVGDLLQVMTNGSFKSVKHRVLADSNMSRLSMIYFGAPPLSEKIAPLPSLVAKEEESLYRELTWQEYKDAAYKSGLSDNRLSLFEKSASR